MNEELRAPFPWFGGKSRAASTVWAALGDVDCYVEPFCGSAAVLLARPGGPGKVETINDRDGFVANFWRAVAADPQAVARAVDWPVNEADLEARHAWLVRRAEAVRHWVGVDPHWYDAKVAGWWAWGACCWIGSGWCSGRGPWRADGCEWGNAGQGVHRQLPHLGDAGRGVHRQLPHLGDGSPVLAWMLALAERLRRVRVACGDWRRVCTPAVVERHGSAGVLLDPPYPEGWSTTEAYSAQDRDAVGLWADVKAAALELSERGVRVVVCGYADTWSPPDGWTERPWTARKGYAKNVRHRDEVLWCSPECAPERQVQPGLFGACEL